MMRVRQLKKYYTGQVWIQNVDKSDPPEMLVMIPHGFDPNCKPHMRPHRILIFRYNCYVAVFTMGPCRSHLKLAPVADKVFIGLNLAQQACQDALYQVHDTYFNRCGSIRDAVKEVFAWNPNPTLYTMMNRPASVKVFRGITMPRELYIEGADSDQEKFCLARRTMVETLVKNMEEDGIDTKGWLI